MSDDRRHLHRRNGSDDSFRLRGQALVIDQPGAARQVEEFRGVALGCHVVDRHPGRAGTDHADDRSEGARIVGREHANPITRFDSSLNEAGRDPVRRPIEVGVRHVDRAVRTNKARCVRSDPDPPIDGVDEDHRTAPTPPTWTESLTSTGSGVSSHGWRSMMSSTFTRPASMVPVAASTMR